MPKPDYDALARRFVGALSTDTEGRPMQWRSIGSIAVRARLGAETDRTVSHARELGWVEIMDGHSVQLTDEGRKVARG